MSLYTSTSRKSSTGAGLALVLALIFMVPMYLWNGLVLMTIWNWFMPPTFKGAPSLNIAQAIGLSIVVSIFTYRRVAASAKEETPLEAFFTNLLTTLLMGVITLVVGAVVHGFM